MKSQKESQNSRKQGFSYYFCMMTEGSGSGSIPLINGSGSGRPKNMWIRWIRIRNTVLHPSIPSPRASPGPQGWCPLGRGGDHRHLTTRFYHKIQCCGSVSWIRCLFDPWIKDPGWVNKQDPDPGWSTRLIFPRAWKPIFWKYINYLMRIRDPENSDPGWKTFRSGINIQDPQHW